MDRGEERGEEQQRESVCIPVNLHLMIQYAVQASAFNPVKLF